jgi:hypothetical protein
MPIAKSLPLNRNVKQIGPSMLLLQESAAGFALFKVDGSKVKQADTEVREEAVTEGFMDKNWEKWRPGGKALARARRRHAWAPTVVAGSPDGPLHRRTCGTSSSRWMRPRR